MYIVVDFFYVSETAFHRHPQSRSRGDIQKITLFKCIVNIH